MLTGEYATECSDASGMQLLDIKNRCWSEEICSLLDIDMSLLAKVYESVEVTGYVNGDAAVKCGLVSGIPVAGGAGDNAAAAIGTGVCSPKRAFTTIGTSGVIFAHTDKPLIDPKGRFHTFCAAVPGEWHVMSVTQGAGLSMNWFKNNIAKEFSYKELDEISREIPIGCEKLLYLPYLMGERTPVLDAKARGMFTGLSSIHTKSHMARAVMEGVSYSLYDCLEVMKEVNVEINDMAICGGGGKSEFWKQMISDVYNLPLLTADCSEGPALGGAILAGCAAGIYKGVREGCEITINRKVSTTPDENRHNEYMKYFNVYKMLYESNKGVFGKLYEIENGL